MELTVCTVNFYNRDYIYFQDYTYRKTADNKDFKRIVCNVTPNNEEWEDLALLPNTTVFHTETNGLRGSESHGVGLNALIPKIDTEYAVLADPDTATLIRGWDSICHKQLKGDIVAIGTPYPTHATDRYRNFPNPIFFFFKVEPVQSLMIDFRPESYFIRSLKKRLTSCLRWVECTDRDTSWRAPIEFQRAGLEAKVFRLLKCDDFDALVLSPDAR